jgi:hypothetical protein
LETADVIAIADTFVEIIVGIKKGSKLGRNSPNNFHGGPVSRWQKNAGR